MTTPLSYVTYTVTDASDLTYDYTLSILQSSHLAVYQKASGGSWAEITDFTVSGSEGSYVVTLGGSVTLAVGDTLWIGRETPKTNATRLVDWQDGDGITASDLDTSALQNLYVAQEARDLAFRALSKGDPADSGDETFNAGGYKISNLGAPSVAGDAVRYEDLIAVQVATGSLPTPLGSSDGSMLIVAGSTWVVYPPEEIVAALALGDSVYYNVGTSASQIPTNANLASSYLTLTGNLAGLSNTGTARTNLGLGTAATGTLGTSAYNVVQLDANSRLPAVDGRNLDMSNNTVNIGRAKAMAVIAFDTGALTANSEYTLNIPSVPYAYNNSLITVNGTSDIVTIASQGGMRVTTNIMLRNTGSSGIATGVFKLRNNPDTTPTTLWTSANIVVNAGTNATFYFDYMNSCTNPTTIDFRYTGNTTNLVVVQGRATIEAMG